MRVSLKAMRVNSELTQAQVAEKMNISIDRVKYLESSEGSSKISYEDLISLCSIYKCSIDDIILPINYPKREAATE